MKKLFAMVLASVMCLALCVPAFATGATESLTDMSTVTVTKVYRLTNEGTTSPAETFTLTQVGDGTVVDGDATAAPALGAITDVTYADGEASVAGVAKAFTITLPTYTNVGVYAYTLAETAGTNAGVTYREGTIRLVVTVVNGENDTLRIAAVHTEELNAAGAVKSDRCENVYSAGSLSVNKTVTGNLGDKTKYFRFTVTLTGETGKTYRASYAVSGGSYAENPTAIAIGTPTAFYLKHGETVTVENLPYGVTYTVAEDDYTGDNGGYAAASYNFSDDGMTIDSANDTVTVTNTKGAQIDTGVMLDTLPYVLALVMVAGAAAVWFFRKRHGSAE